MDRITRRSAYVSTGVHLALVVGASIGAGMTPTAPPAPEPPLPQASASAADPAQPQPGALVIAPEALAAAAASAGDRPALPALSTFDLPGRQPVPVTAPVATGKHGTETSIGVGGAETTHDRLPASTSAEPGLIDELRGRTANRALTSEEDRRATAATFIQICCERIYGNEWHELANRIVNRRLLIEVNTNAHGQFATARLVSDTGCDELDTAIGNFLAKGQFSLPRLAPSSAHHFLVVLP